MTEKSSGRGPSNSLRLGTLMLIIAGLAVNFAAWRFYPGLGVLVTIPSVIALLRAIGAGASGHDRSATEHTITFLATFGTIVLIAFAAWAAFFGTCLALYSLDQQGVGFASGLIVGALVGVGVITYGTILAFRVSRSLRAKRKQRDEEIS